ncbi:TPA: DMT family transporter [Candidatus Woesearchaeota archaeon]|nr:hypothetical protein [uncultured archaeon]MBS3173005.1 DMT family transporter [Candidatus Woesearchaeota archaeon]AQS32913.1 hypothetical protein [uncultured archaeon]AQS34606.1 hypothetical protein [uncultured archaeon]HIH31905.1 DMT family transporter [Candidatus Woesearchaeota archaeon]
MNLTIGILFAFGAMLLWGIGDFLIQRTTRKVGDIQALAWIGIIGSVGLLPFAWNDMHLLLIKENIILLVFLGLIVFVSAILNFEALKKGKLGIIDVVLEIELPITILLSFVFLKEILSLTQMILVIVILIGIILVATKSFTHWRTKIERGVILAIIAAVLYGAVNFYTGTSSKNISPILAVWFPWMMFTVFCLIIIWKREGFSTFIDNAKKFKILILFMGIFDTTAWICYSYAVHNHEISIITAITESYPAIALFLGLWFNKEIIKKHQYLGAALALIGSVILATTV